MPDKFKDRYRISSARLANWDYGSNGAYFITICTAHREHFLERSSMQKCIYRRLASRLINAGWKYPIISRIFI
jgi:hypothetical protein